MVLDWMSNGSPLFLILSLIPVNTKNVSISRGHKVLLCWIALAPDQI